MTIARYRAFAGAAWLDCVSPGWDSQVSLTDLVLEDGSSCVLGQVFAEYADPDDDLYNGYDWATENFDELDGDGRGYGFEYARDVTYAELDQAWTELIEARRAQRAAYATYEVNIAASKAIDTYVGLLDDLDETVNSAPRIVTISDIARELVDA